MRKCEKLRILTEKTPLIGSPGPKSRYRERKLFFGEPEGERGKPLIQEDQAELSFLSREKKELLSPPEI